MAATASAQSTGGTYAFSTIAGRAATSGSADGAAADARFNRPWGVTLDPGGNLYVTEASNHTIRKLTPAGSVSTVAGRTGIQGTQDGAAGSALFGAVGTSTTSNTATGPFGIVVNAAGSLYVADANVHILRVLTPAGVVSTYSGAAGQNFSVDGPAALARYSYPLAIAIDRTGNLYVGDTYNHVIRRISAAGHVTTIAGAAGVTGSVDGIGAASRLLHPTAICVSPAGTIYVADSNNVIRRLTRMGGAGDAWEVVTIAGSPLTHGSSDGVGSAARFGGPPAASSSGGITVRYPSFASPGLRPATFDISYTVGDLVGLAADANENVFVTDLSNHLIRKVTSDGVVTTVGGATTSGSADGVGTAARFQRPAGIAIDGAGNLYIADFLNHTIRKAVPAAAPVLVVQSSSQTTTVGSNVALSITATGVPAPTYQWSRNGVPVAGATFSVFSLNNVQVADAASYAATASNSLGSVTTGPIVVTVAAGPVISTHPESQRILGGQTATLSVVAAGTPAPAYQWLHNGNPLPGQTSSTLILANAQAATAGVYRVVVTNSFGAVTSSPATVSVDTGRIVNLSIRSALSDSDALIAGFVVAGGAKPLLIRAVGPALRQFGVSAAMADPQLTLQVGSSVLATNDNWYAAPNAIQIAAAAAHVGAFPLVDTELDAAALVTIPGNAVTAQTSGRAGAGGVVLFEIYDVGEASIGRLVNVSARTQVGVGENALFAGFTIGGNSRRTLLIRAVGPTLVPFGVSGALTDPVLEVFAGGETSVRATNDNWNGDPALAAAFGQVGAFPLPAASSRDAALIATFEPGSYSARVSGVGNTTGEALLEIYELP